MLDLTLIEIVGIMIVAGAASLLVLRLANLPSIVVYIIVGLVLGPLLRIVPIPEPGGAHAPDVAETVELIAEVGIALLLFLVGLELSLEKVRDVGKVAVVAGIGQVVFTAVGGFALAWLLQFSVVEAIFLGTALTFSSTVVVVKLLDQKKELQSLYGRIAVGIFLVQDMVVIVVLTILAGLESPETVTVDEMAVNLALAFAGMGAMLVVALLAAVYLLPRPMNWEARSPQTLLIWSLCWCLAFVVGAEWLHLSPEIGAFLAGISLAQLGCADELRRRVHPLMNFFIAIFFISLGGQLQVTEAMSHWWAAIVLSLFVLVGNPFIFMWIIAKAGYSERTSFLTSVTVAQISEFSFIFAAVGLSTGLIDRSILSLVAVVGLVTIVASSYMILYNHGLYRWTRRLGLLRMFQARQTPEDESDTAALRDHVVVVGMNALGRHIAQHLHERGQMVLAVDTNPWRLEGLPGRTIVGNIDHPMLIEEIQLHHARLVVSALQIEDTNRLLAYRCKQMGVPVAVHAFDDQVLADLRLLGVDHLIDSKAEGGRLLEAELRRMEVGGA